MDFEEQETPQKLKTHKFIINYQQNSQQQISVSPCHLNKVTPKNSKCLRKSINPRTPKAAQSVTYSVAACSSLVGANSASMHSISMAVIQTPPAKRYQRVKNPFEAALADRLHLPLIASPSLFQRPNTPQLSSTQFEWTIDEVSSLKPVNVEAHETQFHDSPDPELEAKAQSAISSYFKEQQIVPSPIDCPLRSHRIILSEINGNTPLSKPGRRIRDCASQTELTLPTILPPALEEALKPYFQPHLAGVDKELKKPGDSRSWLPNSTEVKDTSLRRKLFDMHNIVVLENENQQTPLQQQQLVKPSNSSGHSNSSPVSLNSLQNTAIVGKLSDSLDKSSFGSLSPISASDSLSPNCLAESGSKRKSRFGNFLRELEEVELLSPIHPPVRRKPLTESQRFQYRSHQVSDITKNDLTTNSSCCPETEENEHFTPEGSSSPLSVRTRDNIGEFSTDSFNIKVSRLKVNPSKYTTEEREREKCAKTHLKSLQNSKEMDIFLSDDIEDMLENTMDMEDMQVSQLSGHSSNCSSSQSDTPRGKRRSASRKNLSQSFSANWLQDDEQNDLETSQSLKIKEILAKKQFTTNNATSTSSSLAGNTKQTLPSVNTTTPKKSLNFYRTDSGFNEMSSLSSCEATLKSLDHNERRVNMHQEMLVCCSTPSTKNNSNFRV